MRKLKKNPRKLEEEKKEPVKKRTLFKKKKETRCEYVNTRTGEQCKKKAFGKGNFCELHSQTKVKEDKEKQIVGSNNNSLTVKYDPIGHPQAFIHLASEGYSPQEIAAGLRISMATVKEWRETFELFEQAYQICLTAYEAYYI